MFFILWYHLGDRAGFMDMWLVQSHRASCSEDPCAWLDDLPFFTLELLIIYLKRLHIFFLHCSLLYIQVIKLIQILSILFSQCKLILGKHMSKSLSNNSWYINLKSQIFLSISMHRKCTKYDKIL